jgi:hypothetical protein
VQRYSQSSGKNETLFASWGFIAIHHEFRASSGSGNRRAGFDNHQKRLQKGQ